MNFQNAFLNKLWRTPEYDHFFSIIDHNDWGHFQNISAREDLPSQIDELSNPGIDIYFACAEYKDDNTRKADNSLGAWAFWLDLDCSY